MSLPCITGPPQKSIGSIAPCTIHSVAMLHHYSTLPSCSRIGEEDVVPKGYVRVPPGCEGISSSGNGIFHVARSYTGRTLAVGQMFRKDGARQRFRP